MGFFNRKGTERRGQVVWNPDEILAPVEGRLIPMAQVNDPVFSQEVIGKGAAIVPSRGRIVAPADGTVNLVFRTKHAIGMVTEAGTELMIHISLDTVGLEGRLFREHVAQGSRVKAGDLLMEFKPDQMAEEGYDTTTMVIVCNSAAYPEIDCKCGGEVQELGTVIRLHNR